MSHSPISRSLGIVHPISLSHGLNARVWDTQGKDYIDFIAGIGVLNLGHCHPRVVEAVQQQSGRLIHSAYNAVPHHGYRTLMTTLGEYIPVTYPLSGMLTNSGAEAAENALKVARAATGRSAVIAFDGGFHGRTLATLNLNGKVKPYKQQLGALPGPVYHVPFPSVDSQVSAEQAWSALERLFQVEIDVQEVAAVIIEPVQGEGGFRLLDATFAKRLQEFCQQQGIVLIVDEVQSGFGRTGERFAFSRLGLEPDLLLLGKSIAAGLPLGAVLGRRELMDSLPVGGLGGTYSGNPLACAAALVSLGELNDDNLHLWRTRLENAIVGRYQRWREAGLPYLGRLTGVGCMRGIELLDGAGGPGTEQLAQVLRQAREQGLLLMPSGSHRHIIRLLPPLTIEPELLEQGLDILESCLQQL